MRTLRELREERALSLRHVASRIGISHVYLREIELGARPIPLKHVGPLAELYGVEAALIRGRPSERLDVSDLSADERRIVEAFVASVRASRAA